MKINLSQQVIDAQLDQYRESFKVGRKNALIQAIRFCFDQEIVAPKWVVDAFFHATNKWYRMDVKTIDEALGVAWPKGKSVAAAKKKRRLAPHVFNAITDAAHRGRAVDDNLFEEVGKPLGVGKTLAKQYYRSEKNLLGYPLRAVEMLLQPFVVEKARLPRQRRKK